MKGRKPFNKMTDNELKDSLMFYYNNHFKDCKDKKCPQDKLYFDCYHEMSERIRKMMNK